MARSNHPVRYAVVDAFADTAFKGNPAAVCLLEEEKDDIWLQSVATEFNLSQTAFLTRISEPGSSSIPRFDLRWFTPVAEVKLCGHASLAAGHFCFAYNLVTGNTIEFSTLSGILTAKKVPAIENDEHFIELDFPVVTWTDYTSTEFSFVSKALGDASVVDIKMTTFEDLLVELPSAAAVTEFQPEIEKILTCPGRGVIISSLASPGSQFDFISRFFCPKLGMNEDPVCGSAHCALALYWSKKLGKRDFVAYQASPRSGVLKLRVDEDDKRVCLQGKAITIMEGSLLV